MFSVSNVEFKTNDIFLNAAQNKIYSMTKFHNWHEQENKKNL